MNIHNLQLLYIFARNCIFVRKKDLLKRSMIVKTPSNNRLFTKIFPANIPGMILNPR